MISNRDELLDFCTSQGYIIANTWYHKSETQKITWKRPGTLPTHEKIRGHYAVKDYWLIPNRWRNGVQDCESDFHHNINTDHYPLTLTVKVTLQGRAQQRKEPRKTYHECSNGENKAYNKELDEQLRVLQTHKPNANLTDYLAVVKRVGETTIPRNEAKGEKRTLPKNLGH